MRVWSRGLGRVELGFDLRKTKIEFADNELILSGKTEPPAAWDFVVKIDVSEAWLLGKIGIGRSGLSLFSKYLELKTINRKLLKERLTKAVKTRTGVEPQRKQTKAKSSTAEKIAPTPAINRPVRSP